MDGPRDYHSKWSKSGRERHIYDIPFMWNLKKLITIFLFLLFLMAWQEVLQSSTMWWWWWFSRSVVSDACDPIDCSLPGSSVHGILQARILEWIAISFSRGSSWPRDWTQASCIAGRFFTNWTMREAQVQQYRLSDSASPHILCCLSPWVSH